MRVTAAEICAELGIKIVPTNHRRSSLGECETCCEATLNRLIKKHNGGHVRFVLMTLAETKNNKRELVAPTVEAVSDVILAHPSWVERASDWFDAFDRLDIPALRLRAKRNSKAVKVRHALAALIYDRIASVFETQQLV